MIDTRVVFTLIRNRVSVVCCSTIEINIKVTSRKIILMGRGNLHMQMVMNIKESSDVIRSMVMVHIFIQTAINLRVITRMIRDMEREYLQLQMGRFGMEVMNKVNAMGNLCIEIKRVIELMRFGRWVGK